MIVRLRSFAAQIFRESVIDAAGDFVINGLVIAATNLRCVCQKDRIVANQRIPKSSPVQELPHSFFDAITGAL